ncbi:MAG: membrane protein insertion efficiency factor YidD [Crocinitomicaceae bacterium]
MRYLLIYIIRQLYQKPKSRRNKNSGVCPFEPTCSNYAILALKKYGSIKGVYLSVKRIKNCNSSSPGGLDYP